LICLILLHNGPFKGEVPIFCQIMARSAAVACAETPSHSRGPGNIRVRVSFMTGAVWSAILATAGLLVQDGHHQLSRCNISGTLQCWMNFLVQPFPCVADGKGGQHTQTHQPLYPLTNCRILLILVLHLQAFLLYASQYRLPKVKGIALEHYNNSFFA